MVMRVAAAVIVVLGLRRGGRRVIAVVGSVIAHNGDQRLQTGADFCHATGWPHSATAAAATATAAISPRLH